MEQNDYSIISKPLESDFISFCKLNDVENIEQFRFECFKKGYYIEKYGLLGEDDEIKPWEIEVVKEVEVVKTVEDCTECNEKLTMISETLQKLRGQNSEKDDKIKELETKINEMSGIFKSKLARFHPGTNLRDTI
jgi:predicted RNase H-like nuclease (RuvC/YqgF family)